MSRNVGRTFSDVRLPATVFRNEIGREKESLGNSAQDSVCSCIEVDTDLMPKMMKCSSGATFLKKRDEEI